MTAAASSSRRSASTRRCRAIRVLWFAFALPWPIAGPGQAEARAAEGAASKMGAVSALHHRAEFPVMGLVALNGDRFLIWHGGGRMQIGTAAGQWTRVFQVGVRQIADVQPDGPGFLVAGTLDQKTSAVLLFSADGKELARWTTAGLVHALFVDARGRWASTGAGLVPLLDRGAMGSPERLMNGGAAPHGDPPALLRRDGSGTVTCRPRNISLQHHAPGRCDRSGPGGWHIEGDFFLPVACGEWLVAVEGTRPWRLAAYSLTTGKSELQIQRPDPLVIACGGPGELFAGDRRLSLFQLPGRKPIWSAKVAAAPLTALAITETALAYRADDAVDVVIIPRPPRPPRPPGPPPR